MSVKNETTSRVIPEHDYYIAGKITSKKFRDRGSTGDTTALRIGPLDSFLHSKYGDQLKETVAYLLEMTRPNR